MSDFKLKRAEKRVAELEAENADLRQKYWDLRKVAVDVHRALESGLGYEQDDEDDR